MTASILIDGDAFTLLAGQTPIGERRRLAGEALTRLQAINRRYALLERRPDPDAAVAIAIVGLDHYPVQSSSLQDAGTQCQDSKL